MSKSLMKKQEEALRYGTILTDDDFVEEVRHNNRVLYLRTRIRTISYNGRIFYHKMFNGDVVSFKELTIWN